MSDVTKPKVLLLFSGGADSYLLLRNLEEDRERPSESSSFGCVTFRYGQVHVDEVETAKQLVAGLEADPGRAFIPHWIIDLGSAFSHIKSPLLGCGPQSNYPGVHRCYVPARNAIFISLAMGLAETYGYEEIWYGADLSDGVNQFPDCTQEWVIKMDAVAQITTSKPIRLRAPLLGWTKEDVKKRLCKLGVDLKSLYSGYGGLVDECETMGSVDES